MEGQKVTLWQAVAGVILIDLGYRIARKIHRLITKRERL